MWPIGQVGGIALLESGVGNGLLRLICLFRVDCGGEKGVSIHHHGGMGLDLIVL